MSDHKKAKRRRADGLSISKRKDGRWEYAVTVGYLDSGNPKRVRGYAKTRAEAVEMGHELARRKRREDLTIGNQNIQICQWSKQWLEKHVKPNREPKTYSYYEGFFRNHIVPELGKVKIRSLTTSQVQTLLNKAIVQGLSSESVRGIRATLRACVQQAQREGLVDQNVVQLTSAPTRKTKEPIHLEVSQISELIQAAEGHILKNLIVFAIYTGVRVGEATGLTWKNVNEQERTAFISQQLQRINGKLVLKQLKSKSSHRTIPLAETVVDSLKGQRVLDSLLNEMEVQPLAKDLVFRNSEGRPLDPKYVDKHLKNLLVKAGLPPMSFHKLRHTTATLLVASGSDLQQVKEILGHSTISLTADLYAHRVSERNSSAISKLDDLLKR